MTLASNAVAALASHNHYTLTCSANTSITSCRSVSVVLSVSTNSMQLTLCRAEPTAACRSLAGVLRCSALPNCSAPLAWSAVVGLQAAVCAGCVAVLQHPGDMGRRMVLIRRAMLYRQCLHVCLIDNTSAQGNPRAIAYRRQTSVILEQGMNACLKEIEWHLCIAATQVQGHLHTVRWQ